MLQNPFYFIARTNAPIFQPNEKNKKFKKPLPLDQCFYGAMKYFAVRQGEAKVQY